MIKPRQKRIVCSKGSISKLMTLVFSLSVKFLSFPSFQSKTKKKVSQHLEGFGIKVTPRQR